MSNPARKETQQNQSNLITPKWHQSAPEVQPFGTVIEDVPIGLGEEARTEITAALNLLLADTSTLRDLYKKCHWQVTGHTFYQLHLLFDKHFERQVELVDLLAERVQILGGVSVAMAHDIAEMTRIDRPAKGREQVPVQLSRLLNAHELILEDARKVAHRAAELGDDGTNDLLVSDIVRTNEMQMWFLREHLVDASVVNVKTA
jgi:starvation-inducible DNA-binding protein